jgi:hypothetical protein
MNKILITLFTLTLAFTYPIVSHSKTSNGGECLRDGECESGECKHFQCTTRIKPKGDLDDRCIYDGDCKSDECEKFRCVVNENKEGYYKN